MNNPSEISTFFDSGNPSFEKAKYIIHQIPYEKTTSFIKGTEYAPQEIIKNSYTLDFLDIETGKEFKDEDFYTLTSLNFKKDDSIEKGIRKIEEYVIENFTPGKLNIFIGGEHTITYPITKSLKEKVNDFSLIYFDAHYDLKKSYENSEYSHACVMRRIYENKIDIFGIGIRAGDKEEHNFVKKNNIKIINGYELNMEKISEKINSLKQNIYISVDFDFFSPTVLPAVGTPELDGFNIRIYKQILNLIKGKNIIGMDFVEFSPVRNMAQYSYMAASIIFKTIAVLS